MFLRGDGALSAGQAGLIQRDAMQRITGRIRSQGSSAQWAPEGAFTGLPSGTMPSGLALYEIGGYSGAVDFDSANSPNARTASETRPLNVTGCWVIKLFGAVVNVGSADAAQLATDYANLAAAVASLEGRVDALEAANVTYVSTPVAITLGGEIVVSHPLAVVPWDVRHFLVCQVAEHGWSVGDEIEMSGYDSYAGGGFMITSRTSTEIRIRVANLRMPYIIDKSTGAYGSYPTNASWRYKARIKE